LANSLPKMLPGAVCPQWVRCGRPTCRCARGNLHGPYYYRFWREDGRLRKAYVKPAELERVRAQCRTRRLFRLNLQIDGDRWRQLVERVREVERS
jgi:hypothetical protein